MKFLMTFLLFCNLCYAQTRTYRFIGKFQESDCNDGYCSNLFIGVSGKTKTFIQHSDTLTYDLSRTGLYKDKWFEIFYYGVYDGLGDDEDKRWFRRIKSIKLIGIPGTKGYAFTGRFKSASVLEGSGSYTFIGLDGKQKDFAHDIQWSQQLPYDFLDVEANANESHIDKWFRITYYGIYGVLSGADGASDSWHRKIYTIEMIAVPRSKDVEISNTSRLYDFSIGNGSVKFSFQNGPDTYVETTSDSSTLKKFPFQFSDKRAFLDKYQGQLFKFGYRIEYELETEEPVTRTLTSLHLLN